MPKHLYFCFLVLCLFVQIGRATNLQDTFTVNLFLLEDCKITQAYTDKLQNLYQEFSNDSIHFLGYFPNPVSEDSSMNAFTAKYGITFPCTRKDAYIFAKKLGITITPEVVVYNNTQHKIMYQGRIDNLFERVGQRRKVVTSHELEAALYCIRQNKPVPIAKTPAVGCFLN